ncbi:hypothetical protein C3Y91_14295 [Rhizobium sp. UPM1133]|nr:hypothetical protein [Rhizobium ruizarguesonis]
MSADAGYAKDSVSFYNIAESGFNFVDDQCNRYFQDLHELEHKRSATKRAFGAFGQTTNAILAITGASAISIAVTAQAFGLAQSVTDAYAGTFLFSLPPSKTGQFVSKIMSAYRNSVAQHSDRVDSGPAVYREIQGYLRLCTPVTIEAMLTEHVADVTAEGIFGPGSTDVVLGSRTSAQQKAVQDAVAPIASPQTKLPKRTGQTQDTPGAINRYEANVSPSLLKNIQAMVCVEPSGRWTPHTREAISKLLDAMKLPRPTVVSSGVTANEVTILQRGLVPKPLKCGKGKNNSFNIEYENVEDLAAHLS